MKDQEHEQEITVRVESQVYAGLEQRAREAGIGVTEYAHQVLANDEAGRRFRGAAGRYAHEWGDHFAERFGHPAPAPVEPHGRAA